MSLQILSSVVGPGTGWGTAPFSMGTVGWSTTPYGGEFGAPYDFGPYITGNPVKTDRIGDVDLFDFQLSPFGTQFVKLNRGNYIRVRTSAFDPWFTGYITNEPSLTFLGSNNGQAMYGYVYEASSDEYILNIKPVGVHSPFLNSTQGDIIKALVRRLDDASQFDTSGIGDGAVVARYVIDPTKTFLTIVKEFTDASNYIFKCQDHKLQFFQADSITASIVIDGNDPHFNPGKLLVTQTTDPIVNDCTVLGGIEPQDYINEYFLGDGYTAQFPLMSSVFGVDSTLWLDDDFSANSVDNSKWNVYDLPQNYLRLSNGYINCLGGSNTGDLDVSLQSLNLIPLEGSLSLVHGQYDFTQASDGVICALWTGALTSDFANCFYGIRAVKSGANTVLHPLVNGVVDTGQSITMNYAHRYILRTIISFRDLFRQHAAYTWMKNGTVQSTGNGVDPTVALSIVTYITEIDPSNAAIIGQTIFTSVNAPLTSAWGTYIPLAANDLHCSMSGVTISSPMQATLSVKPVGSSVYTPQLVGPNQMDALDGLAPVATITDANNGAATSSSLLGTAQYNPGAAILQFFKDTTMLTDTVPAIRALMSLQYRHAGSAVARVQDTAAVEAEALAWGDSGIRSAIRADLSPAPRNSFECERAAKAIVSQGATPRFQGTYGQTYPFSFTGEPKAGTILTFQNLPSQYPASLIAESITSVSMTMVAKSTPEFFDVSMSFGPTDKLRALLKNFATQSDVFAVVDDSEIPNAIDAASVGTTFTTQPTKVALDGWTLTDYVYDMGAPPPTGGGYEVRYTNTGWGCSPGKNLVLRTTDPVFDVPRNQRGKSVFVKAYDTRNKWLYSDDLTQMPVDAQIGTCVLAHGKNPQGDFGRFSILGGQLSINTGVRAASQSTVWSISYNGAPGLSLSVKQWVKLDAGGTYAPTAAQTVICTGEWQRISVASTYDSSRIGDVICQVTSNGNVSLGEASLELGRSTESVYCPTDGAPYGVLSRYAAAVRVSLPGIPPPPEITIAFTDPTQITVTFVDPLLVIDVWGYEIRAADNVTVLYKSDLTDPTYIGYVTLPNNARTLVYNVYSYNLLGEYSV